jgi:LPS-assembly protein
MLDKRPKLNLQFTVLNNFTTVRHQQALRLLFCVTLLCGICRPAFGQKGASPPPPVDKTTDKAAPEQEMTAKIQGFLITAGSAFRDSENEIVELTGGVQLVYHEQHITCDSAKINLRSKKIESKGNVRIITPTSTIGGDHIILDYENNTGIIYNGFVQAGNVAFEGQILQKVSENEYYVLDADYTACTNCPASWKFSGSSIRAELGGYAYIKNSVIRAGPVPILWLPYLIVPLKSNRQSGLLTPDFEHTDTGGVAIAESAFWAISRNTDATFTLKNYELRGLKALLEYRYALDENSTGQLNYATINDEAFAHNKRFNTFRNDNSRDVVINRWFLKYNHYQELPEGYVSRVQLNNASDLQYPTDFFKETLNQGDAAMENRVSVTKNTDDQHYSIDSSYYINMLHSDPLEGNEDAVHRLPELRFSQVSKYIGKSEFLYTIDLDYTNFARSSSAYDDLVYSQPDPNKPPIRIPANNQGNSPVWENNAGHRLMRDGFYDQNVDLIRTGQRLDFSPAIYRSFTFANAFEVTPRVSFRETHYLFPNLPTPPGQDVDSNFVRRYVRTELTGKTTLSQIYGDNTELRSTLWKHEIQPEVTYSRLPWIDHHTHPFFGTQQQDEAPYFTQNNISDDDTGSISGLQFDYNDRIYDRNLVTYSVTNRLVQKRWKNNQPEYRQVALLRLSQSFDAYQEENIDSKTKQPWSDISALLDVRLDNFETLSTTSYFPYQKVTNTNSRVRVIDDKGRFAQLGLIMKYKIVPGEAVDIGSRTQDYSLAAGLLSRHLDFVGKITFDGARVSTPDTDVFQRTNERIRSYSYIAQLKPPGDCLALRFVFEQVTGGANSVNLNLLFSFDGKGPTPLSAADLNEIGI